MPIALITGCNGFCGIHLRRRLTVEAGIRILGVGREPNASQPENMDDYIQGDMCEGAWVDELVQRTSPEIVFHLVGSAQRSPSELYQTNFFSALHLLESLRVHVPEARVLLVGSASEYGEVTTQQLPLTEEVVCEPKDHYGASKHAMTLVGLKYAHFYRMKVVVARPFNIIGPGIPNYLLLGAVLSRAKEALKSSGAPTIKIGRLDSERDFVAIGDVVEGYVRMIFGSFWGEVFNLCSGEPRSVQSIVDSLLQHSDRPIRIEVDASLQRSSDQKTIYGDWRKAHRAFGYRPSIPLETVLCDVWNQEMKFNQCAQPS